MEGGESEITGSFPSGVIGDTIDNLKADRKSTRLNSSHTDISRMPSSAWKKKKNKMKPHQQPATKHQKKTNTQTEHVSIENIM